MVSPTRCTFVVAALLVLFLSFPAAAAVRTWDGGGDGTDWFDSGNWDVAVPVGGDGAVIGSGATVLLTNDTAPLASMTIANATLTFSNWTTTLNATNVTVENGASLTHAICATNLLASNSNRVHIACETLTVDVGGLIDANAMGYPGGGQAAKGLGPGGGIVNTLSGGGGGYGGQGGQGHTAHSPNYGGPSYGSTSAPLDPGSGGAGAAGGNVADKGGAGGGAIRVEATGKVTVNGTVRADGGNGSGPSRGGAAGSGGGLYITCDTLEGTGSLSAHGGVRTWENGGGGGGRIAVDYDEAAQAGVGTQPTATINVMHSTVYQTANLAAGTVYLPDSVLLPENLGGLFVTKAYVYGVSSWHPGALTLNNELVNFMAPSFDLSVGTNLLVTGGSANLRFDLTNDTIHVGGDIIVTNGGTLSLLSPVTNGTAYGALVSVTGNVAVGSGSTLALYSSPTNGGSLKMTVSNLFVASGGVVDADGKGYKGSRWSVTAHPNGYGPGGGESKSVRGGGGGYGGVGGIGNIGSPAGGPTYGSSNAPVQCGSGAGGGGSYGGNGGGLIWVFAEDTIHVDGALDADGRNRSGGGDQDGGGSGGGIYLKMTTFSGTGEIVARGGGDGGGNSGGGGGGRIAIVDWTADTFSGFVSVDPGKFYTWGETGTIVRTINPLLKSLTVVGTPATHGSPTPWPYGLNGVTVGMVITNDIQQTANDTATTRDRMDHFSLTNSAGSVITNGPATQVVFTVSEDLFLTYYWTNQFYLDSSAGPNGGLTLDQTGWYTNDDVVSVTATAAPDYAFSTWSGSGVPAGAATNNPLVLTMDQGRVVQANFVTTLPTPREWTGVGNWFSSTNWNPAGIPGPADDLTIKSGELTITDPSIAASMVVSNGATVVFTNWNTSLSVDTFTVLSGGTVTHALCDTSVVPGNSNRVYVVCSNLTVASGGVIEVSGKGFAGGTQATAGQGPGGGSVASLSAGGGGHGGKGGRGHTAHGANYGGSSYGSPYAPLGPGSGGAGAGGGAAGDTGGAGGGLVLIEASAAVTVDGTIAANGGVGTGSSRYGGGGSGGGIDITCDTLSGAGVFSAVGANKTWENGGGGGGRISVAYDTAAQAALGSQPTVTFSARHATTSQTADFDDGTAFITDTTLLPEAIGGLFLDRIYVYGMSSWSATSPTVSNATVLFMEPGFDLTVANDLLVTTGGGVRFAISNLTVGIGGNLVVTNGGSLTFVSGPTNAAGPWTNCGARVHVTNDLVVAGGGSALYTETARYNGGAVQLRARNMTIGSGAAISADGLGYSGGITGHTYGYGPGGGGGSGNNGAGGGGYGGAGGAGRATHGSPPGGPTYGLSNAPPVFAGSGGGKGSGTAGRGGGLLWLEVARRLTLDGSLTSTGDAGVGYGGGGSGGGVYVRCKILGGTGGDLNADGGSPGSESGGAGGGRIQVWRSFDISSGLTASVAGSLRATANEYDGEDGTVFWGEIPIPKGSLLLIR